MAWRPTEHLIEGELDNTTPGKVTAVRLRLAPERYTGACPARRASARVCSLRGHRLAVAESRRGPDQGAAGRGKKPAKTPPIAVSSA